jgi:hypothetical protein
VVLVVSIPGYRPPPDPIPAPPVPPMLPVEPPDGLEFRAPAPISDPVELPILGLDGLLEPGAFGGGPDSPGGVATGGVTLGVVGAPELSGVPCGPGP